MLIASLQQMCGSGRHIGPKLFCFPASLRSCHEAGTAPSATLSKPILVLIIRVIVGHATVVIPAFIRRAAGAIASNKFAARFVHSRLFLVPTYSQADRHQKASTPNQTDKVGPLRPQKAPTPREGDSQNDDIQLDVEHVVDASHHEKHCSLDDNH
eukprot:55315_1